MNEKNNEIILFETHDQEVKLSVSLENETVWLSSNQMALLFDRDEKTVRKHVNNVFKENELDKENMELNRKFHFIVWMSSYLLVIELNPSVELNLDNGRTKF